MALEPTVRIPALFPKGQPTTVRLGLFTPALLGILATACQPFASTPSPERCGPSVPATAQHPMSRRAIALAGDYDLIQVSTQPVAGVITKGRLHLAPLDSAARAGAVGGAVRDLVGWLDVTEAGSNPRPDAGSRDPDDPGAVLAGDHLRLGQVGEIGAYAEHLTITAVGPAGFWGWWKAEPAWDTMETRTLQSRPDPAGYFCALRVRP